MGRGALKAEEMYGQPRLPTPPTVYMVQPPQGVMGYGAPYQLPAGGGGVVPATFVPVVAAQQQHPQQMPMQQMQLHHSQQGPVVVVPCYVGPAAAAPPSYPQPSNHALMTAEQQQQQLYQQQQSLLAPPESLGPSLSSETDVGGGFAMPGAGEERISSATAPVAGVYGVGPGGGWGDVEGAVGPQHGEWPGMGGQGQQQPQPSSQHQRRRQGQGQGVGVGAVAAVEEGEEEEQEQEGSSDGMPGKGKYVVARAGVRGDAIVDLASHTH